VKKQERDASCISFVGFSYWLIDWFQCWRSNSWFYTCLVSALPLSQTLALASRNLLLGIENTDFSQLYYWICWSRNPTYCLSRSRHDLGDLAAWTAAEAEESKLRKWKVPTNASCGESRSVLDRWPFSPTKPNQFFL
jgi:hypothetical protein